MTNYHNKPAEYAGDDAFDDIPVTSGASEDDLLFGEFDEVDLTEGLKLFAKAAAEAELESDDLLVEADEDEAPVKKKAGPKHSGKHSLKYDSIFKGRKTDPSTPEDYDPIFDSRASDKMEIDPGSTFFQEATDPEEYEQAKRLKERVYTLILTRTHVNINNNRRKPSRADFNKYYKMVLTELRGEGFSKPAIFVELSHYFSDNLYNMFRLLDADAGAEILRDLRGNSNMRPLDDIDFIN